MNMIIAPNVRLLFYEKDHLISKCKGFITKPVVKRLKILGKILVIWIVYTNTRRLKNVILRSHNMFHFTLRMHDDKEKNRSLFCSSL